MTLRNDLERDFVHLAQRAHLREADPSLAVLAARQVALQDGVRGEASQRSDVVEGVAAALAKRPEVAAKRDEHRFGHGVLADLRLIYTLRRDATRGARL